MLDDTARRRRRLQRRRRKDSQERLKSAKAMVRFALSEGLHGDARRRVLKEALFLATEAEFSKHRLTFRTANADAEILDPGPPKLGSRVRHEHVFQRRWVIEQILASPANAENLLEKYAVACVVTLKEAEELKVHDHLVGWARYEAARIVPFQVLEDGSLEEFRPSAHG